MSHEGIARPRSGADDIACECVPPLEMPETWAMPWERQMEAVRAWSEATSVFGGMAQRSRRGSLQELLRLHSLLGAAEEHMQSMRSEVAELAAREMSGSTAPHLAQVLGEGAHGRMQAMTIAAQDALRGMLRQLEALGLGQGGHLVDRRHESRVINFADRRRAA